MVGKITQQNNTTFLASFFFKFYEATLQDGSELDYSLGMSGDVRLHKKKYMQ